MKAIHLFAAVAAILSPVLQAQDAEGAESTHDEWFADYDKALAKAKEEKKALLVDFTGSDWCGWCIKLDKEVFAHDEFLEPIQKDFVLCALDFPNGADAKAKVPNPQRNQELAGKFGVRGYPTILILSNEEDVLGRTGYQEGGPTKYLEHVNELLTSGKQALVEIKALTMSFEKAEDKTPVITKAVSRLAGMTEDTPGISRVAKIVEHALDLDATKHGALRKDAVLALLKSGHSNDKIAATGKELDPKNEHGILEQIVVAEFKTVSSLEGVKTALETLTTLDGAKFKDAEAGRFLLINAAMWCSPRVLDDADRAKGFAKRALEIGGIENPQLKAQLEQLAGDSESAEESDKKK